MDCPSYLPVLSLCYRLLNVCDLGDLRLEQAAVDVLPARFVFVLVGVFVSVEEPLSWCGVDTQAGRQADRRRDRQVRTPPP